MMSNQVYVNGVFSGGFTNTAKFSLYVSPYLVANQGGLVTPSISTQAVSASCRRSAISPLTVLTLAALNMPEPILMVFR